MHSLDWESKEIDSIRIGLIDSREEGGGFRLCAVSDKEE